MNMSIRDARVRGCGLLMVAVSVHVACGAGGGAAGGSVVGTAGVPTLEERADFKDLPARWAGVMDLFGVPGMAVGIVKDGRVYAAQAWGVRDGKGHAPDLDTKFYIASITKTMTATAVVTLAAEGTLSLDDAAVKHLPRFALPGGAASGETGDITIRDLLSHRKGVNCGQAVLLDAYTGEITDDRFFGLLARYGERGNAPRYTNTHFTLLGRVIENATGNAWQKSLETLVLGPVGMTRTSGFVSARDANSAAPMRRTEKGFEEVTPWKTDATMHAAGGLDSTARDMMRWIQVHVNDGAIDGKQVFKPGVLASMTRVETRLDKPQGQLRIVEGFGLAWQVGTYKGTPMASHSGGYEGASAYVAMLPEKKSGFVVLMNASGAARGLADVIAIDVLERLVESKDGTSVYDAYVERAKKEAFRPATPTRVIRGEAITPRLRAAVGAYTNELFGTLTLEVGKDAAGERWGARLGALPLDVTAAESGFAVPQGSDLGPATGEIGDNMVTVKQARLGDLVFTRTTK